MKKSLIIIAAALLTFAACSKVTTGEGNADGRAISFQVANYAQTKAGEVAFSNEDFGTYAWYNADDKSQTSVPFMVNEKVTFDGSNWTTVSRPYYWPKLGSLDFISYSPYRQPDVYAEDNEEPVIVYHPVITESSIAWTDFYVDNYQVDLMYSDKAVGQRENSSTYTTVSGVNGVPTLFHHALARLNFVVRATFLDDGTENQEATTTWEVYVKAVRLKNVAQCGSLSLALNQNGTWALPTVQNYHVWNLGSYTPAIHILELSDLDGEAAQTGLELTTDAQSLFGGNPLYVIPQILNITDDSTQDVVYGQQLEVELTIITHLPGKDDDGNPLVITENIQKSFDLAAISTLLASGK